MYSKICFFAIVLLSLLASCSSFNNSESSLEREEVVFNDGYKTTADGAIIIDDKDFEGKESPTDDVFRKGSEEINQLGKDGSQISIMIDSYGNKAETRTFNDNPLLKFILLKTSADGSKQVFVYGQRGEIKSLPENMFDKILTAPASELANSAGIFESFTSNSSIQPKQQSTMLKPLPSSDFPIQMPQNFPPQPEEIKQDSIPQENNSSSPKESVRQDQPLDEEK